MFSSVICNLHISNLLDLVLGFIIGLYILNKTDFFIFLKLNTTFRGLDRK